MGLRSAYRILVESLKGKISLERPRHRLKDNVKVVVQKYNRRVRTGFVCLRIVAGGGLL
jgi:ribosomal protein L13E